VAKFGIGQPVPRLEDPRFITGRGRYVDDIDMPLQCYGVLVMSPHAHARIKNIDTAAAKAAPGVLAVLTGADAEADKMGSLVPIMPEDMGGPKGYRTLRPILSSGKVRAVGDRVAFVVAETVQQARDAAELIAVDYEPLPAVVVLEDAVKPGAPIIWDGAPNNVAVALMMGSKEATDAAFAGAKHVVSLKLVNNRVSANSIEPRAAIGQYHPDNESYTLYATSQNPHGHRAHVAGDVLKVPQVKLRVISPDVGGGFGMKGAVYPEDALVLWASRRCGGRPVKWVSTRSEAFLGDSHGRDQVVTGELALDEHGKALGLRVDALHDMGSHVFDASMVVPLFALKLAPGVYQIPAVYAAGRAVLTNTPPLQPYRGAGRPEATYLIELLLDRAAHVIGIDPIEIRRRNFVPPSAMPHKLHSGIAFDSGEFMRVMDECLKLADWSGFPKRAAESKKNGRLRGRGIGYFIEEAAIFNDRMTIRFDPSGTLMILAGTHSHGQGHQTVYAQMVHEWLGVPLNSISFIQGDTNEVAVGRGTYGSRSMHVGGNALKRAADAIIEKAKPMAAMMLEAAASDLEFKDGSFHIVGTDRALPLTAVAQSLHRPMFLPPQFEVGLEASGTFAAEPSKLSQWLPPLRSRDRSGDRRGHARALRRRRRCRQGHQQTALRWPDPWRRRARRRPGVDGIDRVRCRWPVGHRQLPGLRHAARFGFPRLVVGNRGGAIDNQSARHQRRRRSRCDRRAAGGDQRHSGCAPSAGHRAHRHAGDAEQNLACHPGCARRKACS
jgi:aerobic carbon-monoxide dehydrogenase large subunit